MGNPNPHDPDTAAWLEHRVLVVLALVCGAGGIYQFFSSTDAKAPLYYFLAAGGLVLLKNVKTLAFGDFKAEFERKLEQRLAETKEQIQQESPLNQMPPPPMARPHELPAASPLPGASEEHPTTPVPTAVPAPTAPVVDPEDPHKGRFGGQTHRNGRVLEAELKPVPGASDWVNILLTVRAEDPSAQPLTGAVVFHLHPSYPVPERVVSVTDGKASLILRGWGVFTIGAVADDGQTPLELDLAEVPGASKSFYEN